MDRKTYLWVAGLIFTLVALFHLVRIFEDWPVIIGDWSDVAESHLFRHSDSYLYSGAALS
jgi:hypothetical protein